MGASSLKAYDLLRPFEKAAKRVTKELKVSFEGFEKYFPKPPEEPMEQYCIIYVCKKLIKLLPVDVEKILDAIEEAVKRIRINKPMHEDSNRANHTTNCIRLELH